MIELAFPATFLIASTATSITLVWYFWRLICKHEVDSN